VKVYRRAEQNEFLEDNNNDGLQATILNATIVLLDGLNVPTFAAGRRTIHFFPLFALLRYSRFPSRSNTSMPCAL
jgi:hypothetical protein